MSIEIEKYTPMINDIASLVDEGHFDFNKWSKGLFAAWFAASGWLAYESVKFYLKIGAEGTQYLPPSHVFKNLKSLGKESAFWCNFSLNWYFMMMIALDIREAYLNYEARKKLDVPYTARALKQIAVKIGLAVFVMAGTTGTLFALIAGKNSKQPVYNQAIVGAVNTLLNFIGSIALENTFIKGWHLLPFSKHEDNEPDSDTEQVKSHIQENLTELQRSKKNNDTFWLENPKAADMTEHLLKDLPSTPLLLKNGPTRNTQGIFTTSNTIYVSAWLGMQYCNIFGLLGWYIDTVEDVGLFFKLGKSSAGAWILGSVFFLTYAALAVKLVHDTINETIELKNAIFDNACYIKENPAIMKTSDFWKAALINSAATLLMMGGYSLAYVSSNSSLYLNAQHGYKEAWNIYPTCISTAIFNGFAFLNIIIKATAFTKKCLIDSSVKRKVMDRGEKIHKFIHYNPHIIYKMSEGPIKRQPEKADSERADPTERPDTF